MGFDLAGVEGGLEFSITASSEILIAVLGVTEDLLTTDDFATIL
jgi:hypothetical protein